MQTQMLPDRPIADHAPTEPHLAEYRGGAMGSTLHIVAIGEQRLLESVQAWAVERVAELEQRWSRFLPTSEVSKLNAAAGESVVVSSDTLTLIQHAIEARALSGGRFDPTLLKAMHANGYDRTFVSIQAPAGLPELNTLDIGLGQITVDVSSRTVTLSTTTGFDPGGIGKGLAADLVAQEMMERGVQGALVNIGGDIRCIGHGPADGAWVIAVGDHIAGVPNRVIEIDKGAVASSTSCRRRWKQVGGREAHHLLDPKTGHPSDSAATLVTVIAARCADAEWIATAIAAAGSLDQADTFAGGAAVMLADSQGQRSVMGNPEKFLR